MNFPYEGGGFCFCPEADGTDDLLDVMVVSNLAKWKVSYLLPMALFGRHTGFPEVHMERCSSLSFQTDRAEPSTWTENQADTARRKGSDWKRSVSAFWATG